MARPTEGNVSFVKRTKENLTYITALLSKKGDDDNQFYEVTNLINCALGLIVFPYDGTDTIQTDETIYKEYIHKYGKIFLCRESSAPYTMNDYSDDNILYHLRNAICHGHVDTNSEGENITELHFRDAYEDKENFYMVMSIEQFKQYALDIANKIK